MSPTRRTTTVEFVRGSVRGTRRRALATLPSLFTLANPLQGENDFGPALSSFEAYRATHHLSPYLDPTERDAARRTPPSDAELRTRYQALRADRTERNRYQAQRSLVSAALLSLFAAALFLFHWRWLRRLDVAANPTAGS